MNEDAPVRLGMVTLPMSITAFVAAIDALSEGHPKAVLKNVGTTEVEVWSHR